MNKLLNNLNIVEQIDWLARWIIINSIIYYDLDYNIVEDKTYDEYSKYLAKLIKENPKNIKDCYYYYVIYDFTGETGFYLKDRLNDKDKEYLTHLAQYIINNNNINTKEIRRKRIKSK